MNNLDKDEIEFNQLSDAVEGYLSQYGRSYLRGEGDFSLNYDYYGNQELGAILLKPVFNELLLKQFQRSIQALTSGWEIWVTFLEGAEWCGHSLIVISANEWRSVETEDDKINGVRL